MRQGKALLAGLLAASALGGCGSNVRQSIGLEVPPPDETLVIARRPLEIPMNLSALPPPQPGAPSRVERDPLREARAALGATSPAGPDAASGTSPGETALLAAAAAEAEAEAGDPDIRATLRAEAAPPERRFGLSSILGYPIVQDPEAEAARLDAAEEARRLREAGLPAPAAPEAEGAPEADTLRNLHSGTKQGAGPGLQ